MADPQWSLPLTEAEQFDLVASQPPMWEHMLLGALLLQGRESLRSDWQDHLTEFARSNGRRVLDSEVWSYLDDAVTDLDMRAGNVMRLLGSDLQYRAIKSAPGGQSDPALIRHLATRYVEMYKSLLDWAADLRGCLVSADARPVFDAAARLADQPITQLRQFVDDYLTFTEEIHRQLIAARGENVHASMNLAIEPDAAAIKQYTEAFQVFLAKHPS